MPIMAGPYSTFSQHCLCEAETIVSLNVGVLLVLSRYEREMRRLQGELANHESQERSKQQLAKEVLLFSLHGPNNKGWKRRRLGDALMPMWSMYQHSVNITCQDARMTRGRCQDGQSS